MKKYFFIFINYQQNDWSKKLAIIEFAANNNKLIFSKQSLFITFKAFHPYISFNIVDFFNANTYKQIYKDKTWDNFRNI